jgi:hypothetical protein
MRGEHETLDDSARRRVSKRTRESETEREDCASRETERTWDSSMAARAGPSQPLLLITSTMAYDSTHNTEHDKPLVAAQMAAASREKAFAATGQHALD